MTGQGAQTAVIVSAGVTFACVGLSKITDGEVPSGRLVASTCLAFAGLGIVALSLPDVGAGLAIAVAGTAFAQYGAPGLIKQFPDTPTTKRGK